MYHQFGDDDRKICLRQDSIHLIRDLKHIIFDFDGVLVSTLESYRQTIKKVVDHYFLEILGLEGEEGTLTTLKDIQMFKDTGLYNDDWHLTYTLITYYLALLMKKLEHRGLFREFANRFGDLQFSDVESFLTILEKVGKFLRHHRLGTAELTELKKDSEIGLQSLAAQVNSKGQEDLTAYLQKILPQVGRSELKIIPELIPYDQKGLDLLKRLFEERYLGAILFERFYGLKSLFNFQGSYIEKERVIPTQKTLDTLYSHFGKFGIYSEKPKEQGMYLLDKNHLTKYFDEGMCIFREDLINPHHEIVQPGKPNPTFFIKMIENLNGNTAYVGDTIADSLLIENAKLEGIPNVVFFGTLSSSQSPHQLIFQFKDRRADAIMTSVNDMPHLYSKLGEYTK
ncbi:MAG: HAD family hydrolase [Thermoproteota archaeon]